MTEADTYALAEVSGLLRSGTDLLTMPDADEDAGRWLLSELWPLRGVVLAHGRPRSLKSLVMLDACVALALGRPACGRFEPVAGPQNVLYVSAEDDMGMVRDRLHLFAVGHEVEPAALGRLHVLAWPYMPLETDACWRARVLAVARHVNAAAVVLDSARFMFPSVDGGPRDGAPAVAFIRRLQTETPAGCVVVVAHDGKPNARGVTRAAERASGGALLSVSSHPLAFVAKGPRATRIEPDGSKHMGPRPPFFVCYESEPGNDFKGFLRSSVADHAPDKARSTMAPRAPAADLAARIPAWLAEHPGSTGNAIVEAMRPNRRDHVLAALRSLHEAGKLDQRNGPRGAILWSVRPEASTERAS